MNTTASDQTNRAPRGGILAYGTYVPRYRLDRAGMFATAGGSADAGTRAVASYDEDTTSMAVEAGRAALGSLQSDSIEALVLATPRPAYLDHTNANIVHAALRLPNRVAAFDAVGPARSAVGTMMHGLRSGPQTMVIGSDVRFGLLGSSDERTGGDAAAALVVGTGGDLIAECLATASVTQEFTHRWRIPGSDHASHWEERFGEHAFAPLVESCMSEVSAGCGIAVGDIDRVIVTGSHPRAVARATRATGVAPDRVVPDLGSVLGNSGAAHAALLLGGELDIAEPGTTILLLVLSDGLDAAILRTTEHLPLHRQPIPLRDQMVDASVTVSYDSYLVWRGLHLVEPPRRPEPERPGVPPSWRHRDWKYGLVGVRCSQCDSVYLPPREICHGCGSLRQMVPAPMASAQGQVVRYTIDRLAFSAAGPVVSVIVEFDSGGRLECELTDLEDEEICVGMRVDMTFRRLYTSGSLHNYFWKARPLAKGNC